MAVPVHVSIDGVWVAESGEYGVGSVIVLHQSSLTMEHLTKMAWMAESDRFEYATAIMNGDDLSGWELINA